MVLVKAMARHTHDSTARILRDPKVVSVVWPAAAHRPGPRRCVCEVSVAAVRPCGRLLCVDCGEPWAVTVADDG